MCLNYEQLLKYPSKASCSISNINFQIVTAPTNTSQPQQYAPELNNDRSDQWRLLHNSGTRPNIAQQERLKKNENIV